jgi:hypothetical protein
MEGTSQACLVIGCKHALGLVAAAAIQVVVKVKIEDLETTSEAAERAEARLVCLCLVAELSRRDDADSLVCSDSDLADDARTYTVQLDGRLECRYQT